MEHRSRAGIHVHSEVSSQRDGRPTPNFEAYRWITGLELADHRSGDADDPRYIRLTHPKAQSKLAQLLADSNGVEPSEPDRFALNLSP